MLRREEGTDPALPRHGRRRLPGEGFIAKNGVWFYAFAVVSGFSDLRFSIDGIRRPFLSRETLSA